MSRSKVTGIGHQGQKRGVHSQHPAEWMKSNALVADNVAKAAGAPIRSLQRGDFAGMRSACGVRWGWRSTTGLCHAFLLVSKLTFTVDLNNTPIDS